MFKGRRRNRLTIRKLLSLQKEFTDDFLLILIKMSIMNDKVSKPVKKFILQELWNEK